MKYRKALLFVFLIILADQVLKIYIKTHFWNGQEMPVFGSWFKLHFIENPGMAYGMEIKFKNLISEETGKIILTSFRLIAVIVGFFFLKNLTKRNYDGFIVGCSALILGGALGNLLDSIFYGLLFTNSPETYCFSGYFNGNGAPDVARNQEMIAHFARMGDGYGKFMQGRVVDMLHFPVIVVPRMPEWIPFMGGKRFEFFEPIFNIADAAISVGVFTLLAYLLFFQKDNTQNTALKTTA